MTKGNLAQGKMVRFDTLAIGDVFSFDAGNGFGCIGIRRDYGRQNAHYTDGDGGTINGFFLPHQMVELLVPAGAADA